LSRSPLASSLLTESGPGSHSLGAGERSVYLASPKLTPARNTFPVGAPWSPVVYDNYDDVEKEVRRFLAASSYLFGKKDHRERTVTDSIGLGIDSADSLLLEGETGHIGRLAPPRRSSSRSRSTPKRSPTGGRASTRTTSPG